ncbi:hypothetical protein [Polaromonas sp. CG_9.11]|uniref:hypothetical protein n=1 Tax=Polaromonas sp. CG_9.11 TaxID=2787730 RepID=UPI0018CACD33|nr:hypothetical protein [Polaromonas sp. CG_9.11]MBG6074209.1 alpha-D-ribose 1-methylphosphonate 5-triphosphate synthase subunit PhnI [Polaromonas sp. CG_9.11]
MKTLTLELVKNLLCVAVDSLEMDGSEYCSRAELKQMWLDLAEALYLLDASEGVARIIGRPELLLILEGVRGYGIFKNCGERLAMIASELARREMDQVFADPARNT